MSKASAVYLANIQIQTFQLRKTDLPKNDHNAYNQVT